MLKTFSEQTKEHLQLGSGLIFSDFEVSGTRSAKELRIKIDEMLKSGENFLGRTKEGASFRAFPNIREHREDGGEFVSARSTLIDGWRVEFSAILLEFKPNLLAKLLPNSALDEQDENLSIVEFGAEKHAETAGNIFWVGDLSNGSLLGIELKNVINVGGISFNSGNESENGIQIRLVPRFGEFYNEFEQPFRIYFIN